MSTIKTKIGFDTKPYTIQAIDFRDLFNFSIKTQGQILLFLATLLSLANWTCLRSIKSEQVYQLKSLQQETAQLKKKHNQLQKEHDALSSLSRLQSLAATIDMHKPIPQKKIYIPTYQAK